MFKCDRATKVRALFSFILYLFDEFEINSIWYGMATFFPLHILSIDAIAFNERSTTMGVVAMGTLLRVQFAFYMRSFCLIANHSILNGLKINLSSAIKMRMHEYIKSKWLNRIEFGFFSPSLMIVITMNARPSNEINLHGSLFVSQFYLSRIKTNAAIFFLRHMFRFN